jgi:hypothetical protein
VSGRTILAAAALAALCTGCRSDGGIDRSDCAPGMRFAVNSVVRQTKEDAANTKRTLADAPDALRRSVAQSRRDFTTSYYLYLQNGQAR